MMPHLARKTFHPSGPPFPLSNWTESDVCRYIDSEGIDIVSLYPAAPGPVVERDGMLIMGVDERMSLKERRPSA